MNYTFRLNGDIPSKKNSRIVLKNGKNIPSKAYQDWHKSAYISLYYQKLEQGLKLPIDRPVTVCIEFCYKDKKRKDCDNGLSSILDTLVDSGILKDDKWQIVKNVVIENRLCSLGASSCKITILEL